jgi:hypothetical protein
MLVATVARPWNFRTLASAATPEISRSALAPGLECHPFFCTAGTGR